MSIDDVARRSVGNEAPEEHASRRFIGPFYCYRMDAAASYRSIEINKPSASKRNDKKTGWIAKDIEEED